MLRVGLTGGIATGKSTAGQMFVELGCHLIDSDGSVNAEQAQNLREEVSTGPGAVNVDVVAPHFPRTDEWAAVTGSRTAAIRAGLESTGGDTPIYLNEERRAEPGTIIPPDAFRRAYTQARDSGAAGWVFHTAAGFSLDARSFVDALTPEERLGLSQVAR